MEAAAPSMDHFLKAIQRGARVVKAGGVEQENSLSRRGDPFGFLPDGGEMGDLIRAQDWSQTPLGAAERWSGSLRSALSICLGSRFPIGLYWGPRLTLLYNDAWSLILGAKHPGSLGRDAQEVWPELWDTIGPMFEQVHTTGESTYSEDSLLSMERHGYREECYFNYTFTPVRGKEGHVEGIFNAVIETTFRVISERRTRVLRELAEALSGVESPQAACQRTAERLGQAGHDVVFAAVWLADEAGQPKLETARGLPPERLLAAGPWPLEQAPREPRAVPLAEIERHLGPVVGSVWPEPCTEAMLAPFEAGAGLRGSLLIGASPRRAVDEDYLAFAERAAAHLAAAASHARALETERQRSQQLAELDRAKTAFFSNVSHEFRTPLTLMLGPTETALQSGALTGEALQTVYRNELRLLKLVNTLLDFARLEAGRSDATFVPSDFGQLTADLASTFRSVLERAGLALEVEIEPLPQPVHLDPGQWEKVVLNLLSNAFKFTLQGKVHVQVSARPDAAVLEVSDTGVGIPAEEVPRLFQRFHRVQGGSARTFEGSGIGLALVHEVVTMHGGQITVRSELGRGSTFTVTVPFGVAHLPADKLGAAAPAARQPVEAEPYVSEALRWLPEPSPPVRSAEEPEAHDERILVVDDNADMRDYLRRILAGRWGVQTASDGLQALASVRSDPPDLVLSDVMMPGLDGFGLLRELRRDPALQGLPVILLSARAGEEAHVEGLDAGADDYLVKPFSAKELVARVQSQLELARMRRAAEAERDRFRGLLAQIPAIVNVMQGPDLVFEFVHPLTTIAVGGRQLLGRPLLEGVPEYADQPYPGLLRRVIETGEPWSGHEMLVYIDRGQGPEPTYWNSIYLPVRRAGGEIEGVMTFDHEVTEIVRARQQLAMANARLQLLSDTSLLLTDRRLTLPQRLREVARLLTRQIGDSCEVVVVSVDGATYSAVALEHRDPQRQQALQRLIGAGMPVDSATMTGRLLMGGEAIWVPEVDLEALSPSLSPGSRRFLAEHPVRSLAAVRLTGGGQVLGAMSMTRYAESKALTEEDFSLLQDVAARVALGMADDRQRKAVEQSEVRFRSLIAASAQVVWTASSDGAMVEDSPTWRAFTGQTRWLGRAWLEAVHPEDRTRVSQRWERAVAQVAEFEAEYRLSRPDGGWSWTIARAVPVRGEDGSVVEWVGTNTDITERKRLEAEAEQERASLREAQAAAERASRAKDEFLAMLGHELRNPLAPILTALGVMRMRSQEAHKLEREIIERQVKHVVRLVDDLLEVSRITRGKVKLERRLVDMGEVIAQAVEMASPLVEQRQQHLSISVDPHLTMQGDPGRLAQIFSNLLTNASKYTPEGGDITLCAEGLEQLVCVSVRDTGIGIRPEMLERIFELFEQERQELDRAKGGLGLGLTIVRSLVAAHGGTVHAVSEGPGKGSEFVVYLPIAQDTLTPAASHRRAGAGAEGPPRRVLVVDDNRDAADLLAAVLQAMGHEVEVAYDGPEALAKLEHFTPEVALLDIGLPVMDGYELARRIREKPRLAQTRLFAVTGYGQARDREQSAAAGFDAHFVKPVDLAEIDKAVRQA
jgi:PAS domain S-box-containing protein